MRVTKHSTKLIAITQSLRKHCGSIAGADTFVEVVNHPLLSSNRSLSLPQHHLQATIIVTLLLNGRHIGLHLLLDRLELHYFWHPDVFVDRQRARRPQPTAKLSGPAH